MTTSSNGDGNYNLMTGSLPAEPVRPRLGPANWESRRTALPILAWTAYFALAPVVWLPGLGTAIISAIKAGLFAVAVWATWTSVDRPSIPSGVLGLLGAVALFLSATFGLFQASSAAEIRTNLYSLALPFVVLWSFWNLPQLRGSIARIATPAAGVLAGLSAVVIYADIARPAALSGPLPEAARAAWVSGFNTQSTGWSHGLALFVPFLAVAAVTSTRRRALLAVAAAALIITSQFVVFGRGGILIAITSVLVVFAVRFRGRMYWLIVVAVLLLLPIVAMTAATPEPDPFAKNEGIGFDQIDSFSSSRLGLLQQGATMIAERPLSGHGFGNDWIVGRSFELQIHVTWLRMAVQGGALFPIVLLAIVLTILVRATRLFRYANHTGQSLSLLATVLVLYGGMVASLIEPSAIIGAFHASSLWWAAAGVTTRLLYDTTVAPYQRQRRHWSSSAESEATGELTWNLLR